jgi:hypothetical protein
MPAIYKIILNKEGKMLWGNKTQGVRTGLPGQTAKSPTPLAVTPCGRKFIRE